MKACARRSVRLTGTLLAFIFLSATSPGFAQAPARVSSITWISSEPLSHAASHAASHAEANGPMVTRPFLETLADHLKAQWPEARHAVVSSNAKRAWQLIASGEQACLLSAVRTAERERTAYFSNTLIGPPQQLIVRRDKQSALPRHPNGEVDLPRLLADERLRGAVVEARSYGTAVDAALEKAAKNANVARYATSDYGSRILNMLSLGRADYTIGYEVSVTPDVAGALVSEPIAGSSALVIAGIACPRNAWGLTVIRKVEQILGTPSGAALLQREAESWLATPETRKRYGPQIEAFYRQRAKPAPIP